MFWTFYILLQRRNIILAFLLFLLCSFSFSLIFSSSTTFALHFISFPFPSSSCYFVVQISFYYSSPSFPLVSFSSTFFSASPFYFFSLSCCITLSAPIPCLPGKHLSVPLSHAWTGLLSISIFILRTGERRV